MANNLRQVNRVRLVRLRWAQIGHWNVAQALLAHHKLGAGSVGDVWGRECESALALALALVSLTLARDALVNVERVNKREQRRDKRRTDTCRRRPAAPATAARRRRRVVRRHGSRTAQLARRRRFRPRFSLEFHLRFEL